MLGEQTDDCNGHSKDHEKSLNLLTQLCRGYIQACWGWWGLVGCILLASCLHRLLKIARNKRRLKQRPKSGNMRLFELQLDKRVRFDVGKRVVGRGRAKRFFQGGCGALLCADCCVEKSMCIHL